MFPNTTPIARSERQQRVLHLPFRVLVPFEPAFGSPYIGVRPDGRVVAMRGEGGHTDDGAGGEEFVEDGGAGGGDDTFVGEAEGGVLRWRVSIGWGF